MVAKATPHARTDPAPPAPQRKFVAVIGGGLAGLAAAKAATQAGLIPTVFDRRTSIGGMWGDSVASIYASLHTNVSRFCCSFSDFPWPPGSPDFPTAAQVGEYLSAYQRAFLTPDKCRLQLGSDVLRVTPPEAQQQNGDAQAPAWGVEWREAQPGPSAAPSSNGPHTERFDFVVVASGFCAAPRVPPIPGLDSFPGLVLHSTAYRGPHSLAGRRRVAVVGSGHSAADIAADLAAAATASTNAAAAPMEVIHVTPRPFLVIPRYLPLDTPGGGGASASAAAASASPFAPLDVMLYRWSRRSLRSSRNPEERLCPSREEHAKANRFWASLCGDEGALLSPVLAVPPGSSDPPVVAISDAYRPLVASGRLRLRRGRLHRVLGSTLQLADGGGDGGDGGDGGGAVAAPQPEPPSLLSDADAIVLCTGMRPSLPFLPPGILETLSYTPHDNYIPLALHRQVLHPDVPGLAFVGLYRSPFFAAVELQARLVAAAFAGTLPAAEADPAAQRAGVELELRVRHHTPRTPYPHTDFVGYADGLAAALGLLPSPEWRAQHDVVIAAHYGVIPGPAEASGDPAASAAAAAGPAPDVAAAPAGVRQALSDMAAAMRGYRGGHRVASAVFQDLAGEWTLCRRIVSRLPSSPSGQVTGTARFTATAAVNEGGAYMPAAGGAGGLSYLYEEQGQFTVQGGAVMRVRREYVYSYDSTADRIDMYFADGDAKRGAFFHSLRFLPLQEKEEVVAAEGPASSGLGDGGAGTATGAAAGWRAAGDHLCAADMYDASYVFRFQGIRLREFEIQFQVKGPNKDYTATAVYTRPASQAQGCGGGA